MLSPSSRPLMYTEARIADPTGQELPPGEVGELLFRGPHLCTGYWKNPQATQEAIDRKGWFHTGDMAVRDADGFYFIAGRAMDMFISGGVNVYPAEIENQLLQHVALSDAAVVGVPDDIWGEVGIAFVVPKPEREIRPGELAAYLEARLARYKVPKRFVILDALPRTEYGKVIKTAAAVPFLRTTHSMGRCESSIE